MAQADLTRLVSKLRIPVNVKPQRLRNPQGPAGRLDKLRQIVTGLVKHERLEVKWYQAIEARGYSERLISEAIRHGDNHQETMEMMDFWLTEKQLIHKLFKVLVPRYQNYSVSYTRLLKAPITYPDLTIPMGVLELRGNPLPPLGNHFASNRNLLHNVLLEAARKDFRTNQFEKISHRPDETSEQSMEPKP